MKNLVLLACLAVLGATAHVAQGQTTGSSGYKLVNLDTPAVPALGGADIRIDNRAFAGKEKQDYGSFEINAGLSHGFGAIVRGTFSDTNTFNGAGFSIRHGGNDFEALLKYSYSTPVVSVGSWAAELGITEPNTPAHHNSLAVGQILYELPAPMVNFFAGARGVFGNHSDVAGLSAGFDASLAEGFHLVGDLTWIFSGDTTYSTATGALERAALYGLAVRYSGGLAGRVGFGVDLGVTNALGGSTGFSLTPGLGSPAGFYIAGHVSF